MCHGCANVSSQVAPSGDYIKSPSPEEGLFPGDIELGDDQDPLVWFQKVTPRGYLLHEVIQVRLNVREWTPGFFIVSVPWLSNLWVRF